jgi:CDP-6-deoxy-D-xylo-4-hexulose-3-dehydrase
MKKSIHVSYAAAVYGPREIAAVLRVLKNPSRIVQGPAVKEFERKIAGLFGKKYGVMVNSGSSANLIAVESLGLPRGSEVVTPILTFSTTVAPLMQKGLVPVFADVLPGAYVIDHERVEGIITPKTKALMVPSLIGNLPDLVALKKIADRHGLAFIEDSCDTLGATFGGKPTGHYTDISTTSFYASHIITAAGGGGMACFRDPVLARRAQVMANWGRASTLFGAYEKSEEIKKRFAGRLEDMTYDAKFIFNEVGYNFQPTESQGAFGLIQLARLGEFAAARGRAFARLLKFFSAYERFFILPARDPRARTNWLAFPLTIRDGAPFDRRELTLHLEKNNIQTRPIFTGNILRQPAFRHLSGKGGMAARYPVADAVMRGGFLIGAHHGMTDRHLERIEEVAGAFLDRYRV